MCVYLCVCMGVCVCEPLNEHPVLDSTSLLTLCLKCMPCRHRSLGA